jgi:hypothetical protein
MQLHILLLIILIPVVILLAVTLYLIIKDRRKKFKESPEKSDVWTCTCKVCNTYIAFDSRKPLPKIWLCPSCNSKNYTQPLPAVYEN